MTALPDVLSPDDLPLPELAVESQRGELFPLGDGYCPLDELEGPALRARAVLGGRSDRLIAELGTAAWIWGASPVMPLVHELCADHGLRARPAERGALSLREVRFDPADVATLAGIRVTIPLRTAVDLARFRDPFTDEHADVVRRLARIGTFEVADAIELMDRRPNLLEKRRARRRLEAVLSPS